MTTLLVRDKRSGEELEVFDLASNREAFVGPPGRPEEGRIVACEDLEPDPWRLVLKHGFTPWTDRLPLEA